MDEKKLLEFLEEVLKLKDIQRTGWIKYRVKDPESVSDHIMMVSLMTLVLGKDRKDVDLNKALRMAVVHDVLECITGDSILNEHKVGDEDPKNKHKEEMKAIEKLKSLIGENEILHLMKEYTEKKTPEANLVSQINKLEMIVQAAFYQKTGRSREKLSDFWDESNMKHIKDPEIRKIVDYVISQAGK